MYKTLLFSTLILMFFWGCTKKEYSNHTRNIVLAKFQDANFNDFFEIENIIPLQSNDSTYLSRINSIETLKDKFVAFDKSTKQIIVFDSTGYILSTIKNVGKGPGEYQYPSSIFIDPKDKCIIITEHIQKKLIYYNIAGSFVKERKINMPSHRMFILNDTVYSYMNNCKSKLTAHHNLIISDKNHKVIKRAFKYPQLLSQQSFVSNNWSAGFIKHNNTLFYTQNFDANIYELNNGVNPRFKITAPFIDLNNVSPEISDLDMLDKFIAKNKLAFSLQHLKFDTNQLFFKVEGNDKKYMGMYIYNLKNERLVRVKHDKYNHIGINPTYSTDNKLYVPLEPSVLSILRKSLKPNDTLYELARKVKPNDNPIIVVYKFKDHE